MSHRANTSFLKDNLDEKTLWSMRQPDERRILVVDDEPMIRNILKAVVEAEGFSGYCSKWSRGSGALTERPLSDGPY
jgi:hypothetical protein